MDKITQLLEKVVRCKYFEAGVHIKNPIKNSYQDGLGRTTQTLNHVVVVHILIWDKRKSQINEYNDSYRNSDQRRVRERERVVIKFLLEHKNVISLGFAQLAHKQV
jgi:hypothetical protein